LFKSLTGIILPSCKIYVNAFLFKRGENPAMEEEQKALYEIFSAH
jgi:hypothetical protein